MWSIGKAPPNGIALKLRAQRPQAQGGGAADKKAGRRGNAILPTRAPGSFKRLLGRCSRMPVTLVGPAAYHIPSADDPMTLKHLESGSRLKCRVIDIIDQRHGHGG